MRAQYLSVLLGIENAAEIHQQGQRTEGIIQGMLMHARSESDSRELTEINTLLARAFKLAYHGVRAKDNTFKINLETNYDQSLSKVKVVPSDISRAFLNIFSNACYALQEKKREMGQEFNPVLSVRTTNLGDKIEICIRDNGSGIPPDTIDKIFDAFFTTKPPGEGTGLGLSITHDIIVGQHQGEIKLGTQLGDYTEFKLSLPLK